MRLLSCPWRGDGIQTGSGALNVHFTRSSYVAYSSKERTLDITYIHDGFQPMTLNTKQVE